jgi:MFS-type transporter involved in bile tolerance (Atg22 family)
MTTRRRWLTGVVCVLLGAIVSGYVTQKLAVDALDLPGGLVMLIFFAVAAVVGGGAYHVASFEQEHKASLHEPPSAGEGS